MFWLHASFGLGVTGGTWVMSGVVNSGESWRWGYTIVGIAQLVLGLTFFITRARFDQPHPERDEPPPAKIVRTPIRATLVLPVVWLGIALFFLYTGVEVTAGRWSSSLFIEGRDIEPEVAGLWVSAYWGMFTVGRVAAGFSGAGSRRWPLCGCRWARRCWRRSCWPGIRSRGQAGWRWA